MDTISVQITEEMVPILDAELTKIEFYSDTEDTPDKKPSWRPLDTNGDYDPKVDISVDDFLRLNLDEQVDRLLWVIRDVMTEWHICQMTVFNQLPGGGEIKVQLERESINPRRPFTSSRNQWLGRYEQVILPIVVSGEAHQISVHNPLYRTIIVGLMMSFLVQFHPEKYKELVGASSYYATALIIGNDKAPIKYRRQRT